MAGSAMLTMSRGHMWLLEGARRATKAATRSAPSRSRVKPFPKMSRVEHPSENQACGARLRGIVVIKAEATLRNTRAIGSALHLLAAAGLAIRLPCRGCARGRGPRDWRRHPRPRGHDGRSASISCWSISHPTGATAAGGDRSRRRPSSISANSIWPTWQPVRLMLDELTPSFVQSLSASL